MVRFSTAFQCRLGHSSYSVKQPPCGKSENVGARKALLRSHGLSSFEPNVEILCSPLDKGQLQKFFSHNLV